MSLGAIVFVAALSLTATGAFFSDTETSTGNTFTAGALDLKVDSQSHFNGLVCLNGEDGWRWRNPVGANPVGPEHYPQPGTPCGGTWSESDLIKDSLAFRFFNFDDLKPGDEGENTISLHVYNNDAWGCMLVDNVVDSDVTCTEPESEDADDLSCTPNGNVAVGELGAALTFDAWLDEGTTPGFQCNNPGEQTTGASCQDDPFEGDNIKNGVEVLFWENETVDGVSEGPFAISDVLKAAYLGHACTDPTGHEDYEICHGLAEDGRMVGSVTYYWGLAWDIPPTAGNEIQTDQLTLDMIFEVAQHRNNPNFSCTPPSEVRTTLTLAKTVLPAEQEPDSSYTLIADGAVTDLSGIEGTPQVFFAPVTPGNYALSETGGDQGAVATWSCTGNATAEVPTGNGTATVDVAAGENVVCVVTNDYTNLDV